LPQELFFFWKKKSFLSEKKTKMKNKSIMPRKKNLAAIKTILSLHQEKNVLP